MADESLTQAFDQLPQDLKDVLQGGDGWQGLENVGQQSRQAAAQDHYDHAVVIARPFMSEDGQAALRALRQMTIEQPTFVADYAPNGNGDYAVYNGFSREGQNSIIRYIERCIATAQEGPPKGTDDGE